MRHTPFDFVQFPPEPAVMRSSPWSIAAVIALAVFLPAAGVLAEGADFDKSTSDGSQFSPAGPEDYVPKAGNLNSVPEDGISLSSTPGGDSPLVKQILASRPNEDVVICVAGCYAGTNRVIYAQPSATTLHGSLSSQPGVRPSTQKQSAAEPRAPTIINPTN
jgi:hypothetical protein